MISYRERVEAFRAMMPLNNDTIVMVSAFNG